MLWGVGSRSTHELVAMFWLLQCLIICNCFQLFSILWYIGFCPLCDNVTTWTDLRLLWLTFSRTLVILLLLSFTMRLKEWVLQCFSILHFKIQRTLSLIAPSFRHFGLRGYAKVPSVKYVLNSDDCGFVPSIPSTIRYKIERVFDSSNQRRYLLNCLLVIHMFSRDGITVTILLPSKK